MKHNHRPTTPTRDLLLLVCIAATVGSLAAMVVGNLVLLALEVVRGVIA